MPLDKITKHYKATDSPESVSTGEITKGVIISFFRNLGLELIQAIVFIIIIFAFMNLPVEPVLTILDLVAVISFFLVIFRVTRTDNYLRRQAWANSANTVEEKRRHQVFADATKETITSSWNIIIFLTSVILIIIFNLSKM